MHPKLFLAFLNPSTIAEPYPLFFCIINLQLNFLVIGIELSSHYQQLQLFHQQIYYL